MKSLADWNRERTEEHEGKRQELLRGRPNGIACPECGDELIDPFPSLSLTSSPLRTPVRCDHCGYRGNRVK